MPSMLGSSAQGLRLQVLVMFQLACNQHAHVIPVPLNMLLMQGITSTTASVTITGNPLLTNISALASLGNCSNVHNTNAIAAQVYLSSPPSQCTLTSWAKVCAYIAAYTSGNVATVCSTS